MLPSDLSRCTCDTGKPICSTLCVDPSGFSSGICSMKKDCEGLPSKLHTSRACSWLCPAQDRHPRVRLLLWIRVVLRGPFFVAI